MKKIPELTENRLMLIRGMAWGMGKISEGGQKLHTPVVR